MMGDWDQALQTGDWTSRMIPNEIPSIHGMIEASRHQTGTAEAAILLFHPEEDRRGPGGPNAILLGPHVLLANDIPRTVQFRRFGETAVGRIPKHGSRPVVMAIWGTCRIS